jgi:WD40 repeat protein
LHGPDGQLLASGGADTKIRFWNTQEFTHIRTLDSKAIDGVYSLSFSPDSLHLISTNEAENTVKL